MMDSLREVCEKQPVNRHAALYKTPTRNCDHPDYYEESPQEIRRQRLLREQKKNRDASFNLGRGLLEDAMQWDDSELETDLRKHNYEQRNKRDPRYANQLMMSEWMLEIPPDLIEKWLLVPCPTGHRTLLVASRGSTTAYSKRGVRLGKFNSALPGGFRQDNRSNYTILDTMWSKETKTYYVLDVLAWSNQALVNCDTEFRTFWLKTRLEETNGLKERASPGNTYPILPLPRYPCDTDPLEIAADLSLLPPLDGLLFYHKEAHYTKGRTPLVTWIKPFMMPEVFHGTLPAIFCEKPADYIDMRSFIEQYDAKTRKSRRKQESMEVESLPAAES